MAWRFPREVPTGPSPRLVTVVLLALAASILAGLPSVAAVSYEGPGHTGIVPVGDGGVLAALAPVAGEGVTHVPLSGIDRDVCQIDLEEAGEHNETLLVWSPGNLTAYVAADPGAVNAPFRVTGHWERDMNDACTVEVTPDGKTWHDPRGRPFIETSLVQRLVTFDMEVDNWTRVGVQVHNNGTLTEHVNLTVKNLRDEWETRNATRAVEVPVGPLQTVWFGFELLIPATERAGMKVLAFELRGAESGWAERGTVFLDVSNDDPITKKKDDEGPSVDSHHSRSLPKEAEKRTGQVPVIAPTVPLAVLALVLAWTRSRRQ